MTSHRLFQRVRQSVFAMAAVSGCLTIDQAAAAVVQAGVDAAATYQEGLNSACSTAPATTCVINFGLLPPELSLIVRFVSCELTTDETASVRKWFVRPVTETGASNALTNALNPVLLATSASSRVFQVSQPVFLVVAGNRKPQITVVLAEGDITNLNCNISGRAVPNTP